MITGTPSLSMRAFCAALLAASAIFSSQLAADSVVTQPVGFYKFHAVAGTNTFTPALVTASEFQSTMTSYTQGATTAVITQSNAAWTANQFAEYSAGKPAYYIEILDAGTTQGLMFDIQGNTTTTLTVYNSLKNLSTNGVSQTASYVIRKHATLAALFPNSGGVNTSGIATDGSESVDLYFSNGTTANFYPSGAHWYNSDTNALADNQIVQPGQGFILNASANKDIQIGSSVSTVLSGSLKVPAYNVAVNIIGLVNPSPGTNSTLGSLGLQSSFASDGSDSVTLYQNGSNFTQLTNSYSDGTNLRDSDTNSITTNTSIALTTAVVVNVGASKYVTLPSQYTNN
jgi:uncharacterized protein (TIGR02597 family)